MSLIKTIPDRLLFKRLGPQPDSRYHELCSRVVSLASVLPEAIGSMEAINSTKILRVADGLHAADRIIVADLGVKQPDPSQ
jgi:hypothetical protein